MYVKRLKYGKRTKTKYVIGNLTLLRNYQWHIWFEFINYHDIFGLSSCNMVNVKSYINVFNSAKWITWWWSDGDPAITKGDSRDIFKIKWNICIKICTSIEHEDCGSCILPSWLLCYWLDKLPSSKIVAALKDRPILQQPKLVKMMRLNTKKMPIACLYLVYERNPICSINLEKVAKFDRDCYFWMSK